MVLQVPNTPNTSTTSTRRMRMRALVQLEAPPAPKSSIEASLVPVPDNDTKIQETGLEHEALIKSYQVFRP